MRIYIETAGGGGIVLLVVAVLLAGHGGGISAALVIAVIVLAVVVVLAAAGTAAALVHRARQEAGRPSVIRLSHSAVTSSPPRGQFVTPECDTPAALEQPAVRLHPEQLAELAEIIRRDQRPEQ